jgi:hypothetical protein
MSWVIDMFEPHSALASNSCCRTDSAHIYYDFSGSGLVKTMTLPENIADQWGTIISKPQLICLTRIYYVVILSCAFLFSPMN